MQTEQASMWIHFCFYSNGAGDWSNHCMSCKLLDDNAKISQVGRKQLFLLSVHAEFKSSNFESCVSV